MTTVLITGCSSGYGLATAHRFLHEGWNVVATMRTPREDVLPRSDRVHLVALDVTSPDSIADAIESAGQIDVLVNNAGIGAVGVFEANPMEVTRELFETNTFGVMAMTQAVVPQMRARRSGVIVNVTSSVTLAAMPPGRGVHRQQDGHRRFHGLACTRARLLRRAGQARGTGIRPVNGVRQQWLRADGGDVPTRVPTVRGADHGFVRSARSGDHPAGCGRRRLSRGHRHVRAAPVPGRCRRGCAGEGQIAGRSSVSVAMWTREMQESATTPVRWRS